MVDGEVSVQLHAAEAFGQLARDLRRAGAGGLRRELYKGLQRAARPALDDVRRSAGTLPTSGGLAARVQGASFRVRALAGRPGSSTIRFTATERRPIAVYDLDRGRLRHPLFGDRGHWYRQRVPPGWFTGPLAAREGDFEQALLGAVEAVEREITG